MGLAHARLGWAHIFAGRYEEAIARFELAVEIEPNHSETYIWFTEASKYAGDPASGTEYSQKALETESFNSPPVYSLVAGHSYFLLRDYETAERLFKRTISKAPGFPLPYLLLGIVYYEMGWTDDTAAQFNSLYEAIPPHVMDIVVSRLPYRDDEPKRRMREALDNAGSSV